MVASCLIPILLNGYDLLLFLMGRWLGVVDNALGIFSWMNWEDAVRERLSIILILTPLVIYHAWWAQQDIALVQDSENATTVRRLFLLSFAFGGIVMVTTGMNELLLQLFREIGTPLFSMTTLRASMSFTTTKLFIGIPLWLWCWINAQRLFAAATVGERESAIRKFYLYALIITTFFTATVTIRGVLIMNLLEIAHEGGWREVIATLIPATSLWGYHRSVLHRDEQVATEAPRQATVRRLHLYLIAAIGLVVLLGGVVGIISALIQPSRVPGEIAVAISTILVGVPVWLLPWRRAQAAAVHPDGHGERQSLIRRLYLYGNLFLATLAVLGAAIYSLTRILTLVLGASFEWNLLADIAPAVALLFIGVGAWLYHGMALRGDGQHCLPMSRGLASGSD